MSKLIIKTKEAYTELIEKLIQEEYIAMDTETQEFDEENTHVFDLDLDGIGVYTDGCKAYIPQKLLDKEWQKVLDGPNIIFHNAKFDLNILQKEGYNIDNLKYEDTMLMSWLVNENRSSHALKSLAQSVLKVKEENITKFGEVMKRPTKESLGLFHEMYDEEYEKWEKQLGLYCIDDCKYTYKLFKKWKTKLEQDEIWNAYRKIELPLVRVLMDMENRGICLDCDYLRDIGGKIEKDIIRYQAEIWQEAGKEFDVSSSKQLSEVLYNEKGYSLPDEYKTPTGAYSTNEAALKYLADKHSEDKLPSLILKYRDVFKLHTTYINGFLEKQRDGVIYGSFRQTGAKTGRLSSSNPNLQQLPRRDDEYNIRKAFKAREGYTFVIGDLSQIELRVMAFLAKDPNMISIFQKGGDIHAETANLMGVDRVVAKSLNFGVAYGATAYSIAKGLGISLEEGEDFVRNYFKKFEKVALFIVQAKNTINRKYAIQTISKRRRRFPLFAQARKNKDWAQVKRMQRQAVNAIIQGSAADIIKAQMRDVHKALKGHDAHLLVQIHDELIVECPIEKAEEVKKIVKDSMENAIILPGVPIITEPEISDEWKK